MIETHDLILRAGLASDWKDLYHNLWDREEVFRYLFSKPSLDEEAAKLRTTAYAQMHREVKTEFFVCEKSSGQPIGIAGIKELTPGCWTVTDIAIGPDFQNKGYGKQVVISLLDLAFDTYGAAEVSYECFVQNRASEQLALSCGFHYSHPVESERLKNGEKIILNHYKISRENPKGTVIEIETPRLILRKFQYKDKQDMFEICSDEQWCLDDGGYHAFAQMDEKLDDLFKMFIEQQRYAVVLKPENKMIGIINMMRADRAVPAFELGFGINRKYQRNGYAYEAVSNIINTWFTKTETQMFLASHFPYNTASKKLIEKLGFTYEGCKHKILDHALYGPIDLECYYLEKSKG